MINTQLTLPSLSQTMDKKLAISIVGNFSKPSKMPCYGFSISAKYCKTGQKLRKVPGSVCSKCYALKGRYSFAKVRNALERRFAGMSNPRWAEAMAFLVGKMEKSGYFRFFDSGDLADVDSLDKIVKVCRLNPGISFWLPTREYSIVASWVSANGAFPSNLTVRLSSMMLDGAPPVSIAARLGVHTSSVMTEDFTCPAPKQGGKCGDCRACWDKAVANVGYKKH